MRATVDDMARTVTDTPTAVLDAALTIFERDGVPAARLEDVATEAGVTRATLYYHFHGKDALVAALLDRAVTRLAEEVAGVLGGPVRAVVTTILRVYGDDQALYRLLFTELWGPLAPHGLFERIEGEVLAPITARIERAAAAGEIRAVEPRVAALSLFGQASAVALGAIMQGQALHLEALDAELGRLVDAALSPEG